MKKSLPYILASLAFVTFGYILLQNDNRTNPAQIFDSDSLTTLKSDGQIYEKSKFTKTGFTWKDSKGDEFPVYIAHTDSCFIIRTSKSGENYMAYLGEEVSEHIIRKTKCSRVFKRSVQSSKTKCPLSCRENLSFQV